MLFFYHKNILSWRRTLSSEEEKAVSYYKEQNYAAALRCFLQLSAVDNKRDDILVYIANCYDALGKKEEAAAYYTKACKINKKSDIAPANLAIIFYEMQDLSQAKKFAEKTLAINPHNPSALSVLGNVFYRQKKYDKALKFYQQAMAVQRDFYTAVLNAASIYFDKHDYATAYFYAKRAVSSYPDSDEAKNMLASICVELEYFDEAILLLADLYKKNPEDYWLCNLLSQAFQQKKDYNKALEMGWRAVTLSKGDKDQHINFGYLLYEIAVESPTTDVLSYVRKWQKQYSDNPIVKHMSEAMLHAGNVNQINSTYVRDIFDAFADDFENVLDGLDYAVPSLMGKTLENLAKNVKLKKMKILDAGCGTGLCGEYLKKYARFRGLDGVDLSEKMLDVARKKKIYTHLYNQDLNQFLSQHAHCYDLINAADVLTYFGELGCVFIQMFEALKPGGRVLFSISENSCTQDNYFLHLSGRFLHNRKYVEDVLKKCGFIIEKLTRVKLRNEGNLEVWGWIVMARKP